MPRHARRMATLLVVHHFPTPTVQSLTDAVLAGAHDDAIEGVEVVVRPALEADVDDVLAADGYLLGTTANFGYMSGALSTSSNHLPGGGRCAGRRRVRERGRRYGEAVRALRARALRHRGRDPLRDLDRAVTGLEAVGGGALGGRRHGRGGEGTRVRARGHARGTARRLAQSRTRSRPATTTASARRASTSGSRRSARSFQRARSRTRASRTSGGATQRTPASSRYSVCQTRSRARAVRWPPPPASRTEVTRQTPSYVAQVPWAQPAPSRSCASARIVWIVLSSASRADTRSWCASRRRSARCSDRRPVNDIPVMI